MYQFYQGPFGDGLIIHQEQQTLGVICDGVDNCICQCERCYTRPNDIFISHHCAFLTGKPMKQAYCLWPNFWAYYRSSNNQMSRINRIPRATAYLPVDFSARVLR
jgi:hypothetical protein